MLSITCGFCNTNTGSTVEFHDCEDKAHFDSDVDYFRTRGNGMSYSTQSILAAEAFLIANPEFVEKSVERDAVAYRKVATGLGSSPFEELQWITPNNIDSDGLPITEFADTEIVGREEEWASVYENREFDTVMQGIAPWKDVEPTRCTTAFHYWKTDRQVHLMPKNSDGTGYFPMGFHNDAQYVQAYEALDFAKPELMRLEFNELKGFASQLLIDADITEKFQFTVFNAYVGRDSKFHIGLLTFDRTNDGQVAVTCKHRDCHYGTTPFFSPLDPSREQMEDFVMACIRHGNNHGPNWLLTRKDFTFIHANNCDAVHGTEGTCNANSPRLNINVLDESDVDAVFSYLIHHRKFCATSGCRCTHYYHLLSSLITEHYTKVAA